MSELPDPEIRCITVTIHGRGPVPEVEIDHDDDVNALEAHSALQVATQLSWNRIMGADEYDDDCGD